MDYPVLFAAGQFREGDLAVYIPVDALVPRDDPRWAFLEGHCRIKAKRLRGIFSCGLLTELPDSLPAALPDGPSQRPWQQGDAAAVALGIVQYEPPEPALTGGENEKNPGFLPIYTDIEGLRRYPKLLVVGEPVVLLEKVHGCNARYCFKEGRLWCGSHHQIKRQSADSLFWRMAEKYTLPDKLARREGWVFYGEIFGWVQDLRYGATRATDCWLVFFDVFDPRSGRYLDWNAVVELAAELSLPLVPEICRGPWSPELKTHAEGMSEVHPGTLREGFVVRPLQERIDDQLGRVILKLPGETYLTRK
ncbi:MAG: hypothetical protein HY303_13710 [Candidatus Wallbacteria bacterium]|nr:hypothetical protein [Candidatus Wallbacteria bacterium]